MEAKAEFKVIEEMVQYLQDFVEIPHPAFGNLPVCPFARQARLNEQIQYAVYPFSLAEDLQPDSLLMMFIQAFSAQDHYQVLWMIHPHKRAMSATEIRQFIPYLNQRLMEIGLVAFGGHPDDAFNIQGVYTRQEPYLNFTIQTQRSVKEAYRFLSETSYYKNWSEAELKALGLPR